MNCGKMTTMNNFEYGIQCSYKITPNTEAAEFLQAEVQKYFGYESKSKREKYADIWVNSNYGINVKTDNLCSKQNKGRLCTAEINQWLKNENNKLSFIFIEYTNTNGDISIKSVLTKDIEEVEYDISNQGKGLLQPKRYRNKLIFRKKVSRQDWLEEFKGKYLYFIEQQKSRFDKLIANWFD